MLKPRARTTNRQTRTISNQQNQDSAILDCLVTRCHGGRWVYYGRPGQSRSSPGPSHKRKNPRDEYQRGYEPDHEHMTCRRPAGLPVVGMGPGMMAVVRIANPGIV